MADPSKVPYITKVRQSEIGQNSYSDFLNKVGIGYGNTYSAGGLGTYVNNSLSSGKNLSNNQQFASDSFKLLNDSYGLSDSSFGADYNKLSPQQKLNYQSHVDGLNSEIATAVEGGSFDTIGDVVKKNALANNSSGGGLFSDSLQGVATATGIFSNVMGALDAKANSKQARKLADRKMAMLEEDRAERAADVAQFKADSSSLQNQYNGLS